MVTIPLGLWTAARRVGQGLLDELRCPAGHLNAVVGRWECRCGNAYLGHAFAPCGNCGAVAGWIQCEQCELGVRSPFA